MTKKKKVWIILFSILGVILTGFVSAYFVYGSTLLNGYDEKTIIKSLSKGLDIPVEILEIERYEDHLGVLYKDPNIEDPYNDFAFFAHYIKHDLYKNKYYYKGGNPGGNFSCTTWYGLTEDELERPYFIYDIARDEKRCIAYELDAEHNFVRKLEEFDLPQNEPYIILKKFELLNILHDVYVINPSWDYPHEYNENYLETDKEWINSYRLEAEQNLGGKINKEMDELYEKAFGEKP